MPALEQRRLEFVGHAVKRLEFIRPRVEAAALRLDDGVGAGADVVRRKGRGDDVDVLEQQGGKLLKVGVAFRLVRPHRHGPVALPGEDGLGVPVGALHEADGEGAAARAGPGDQRAEVPLAVAEVGLEGDADRRALAELGFFADRAEKGQREVLQLVALHVEVDEGPDFDRAAENGAQPLLERDDAGVRVGRVHVGRQRGDLDRKVEPGQRPAGADIAETGLRLGAQRGGEGVEHLEVATQKFVGLRLAHDGFAEQVNGGGAAGPGIQPELFDQILRAAAGDELPGHVQHPRLHRAGHERRGERGGGEAGLEGGMQGDRLVAEIFLQVADDLGGRIQRGQHVHEAEKLRLERRILHRPFHQAGVSALFGEDAGRRVRRHQGEELFAFGAERGFQPRVDGQESSWREGGGGRSIGRCHVGRGPRLGGWNRCFPSL